MGLAVAGSYGQWLWTGADDRSVRVWNKETADMVASFTTTHIVVDVLMIGKGGMEGIQRGGLELGRGPVWGRGGWVRANEEGTHPCPRCLRFP